MAQYNGLLQCAISRVGMQYIKVNLVIILELNVSLK